MQFRHEQLPNGLDIVAEVSEAAHSASLGFFVKTGARDEHESISGMSHFLEHMVFKGTDTLSAEDINLRFDSMGASSNAFTSEEDTVYYAAVLPEKQHDALELLSAMMRPALREDDFVTEKQVILEEIKMYDDQPPFGADDRCRALFFKNHPLAQSVLGSTSSIESLQVEAMREYHQQRYSSNNLVLAASGAVDFESLIKSAHRLCGEWKPSPPSNRKVSFSSSQREAVTEVITREQAALEYAVRMSPGPAEDTNDRFAAKLLAMVIGDDSGSRLYWDLVDSGRAEHAACHHHDFLDAGIFVTQLSCEPETTHSLLDRIVEIYQGAEDDLSTNEVDQARNKLLSRVVLAGERPRQRLFSLGLEWAHLSRYRSVSDDLATLDTISREDLHRILAEWHLPASSSTVLAGPLSNKVSST
ncbi:MAG: pitrilysin family protein [Planctomycetota bacterium]|jgi:predicted Zn-dependent peptidase|nr:pitrilysin family protein [Planctomycetota bacterium]MEC8738000.1 pitrilysin family protein [Planctomycetota bacterium]MEE2796865.1 pitrilysin family protein [Planctomycetota bacterium]